MDGETRVVYPNTMQKVIALLFLGVLVAACGKDSYACRSRQSEAKADLTAVNNAQTKFREANSKFASSFEELHFIAPETNNYDVKIEAASATTYSAIATGKGAAKGDLWSIDQLGNPVVKTDACQ